VPKRDDKLELPGWPPIPVVTDEKAEECDFLVCVPANTPSRFEDNLTGFCCECGVKVIYRWHAPRKPKRICMDCMVKLGEQEQSKDASPT
jgi:hypothetical protein